VRHCAAGPACQRRAVSPRPPAPSRCPPGPHVVAPHCQPLRLTSPAPAASPVVAAPATPTRSASPAAVRAARSHHARVVLAHMVPHPGPSFSAPILPRRGTDPTTPTPPFSLVALCPSALKASVVIPLSAPLVRPAPEHVDAPPSTLDSVHRPRTPGSSWPPASDCNSCPTKPKGGA
jgi:hypothetical protein